MRPVLINFDIFTPTASAKAAREAEFLAMHRRPDAPPLPDEATQGPGRLVGWLRMASERLARRRAAARARRAAS